MSELKAELMSGVADFQAELKKLDSCLARLIRAEEDLQRDLRRLARLERRLDPRRLVARLQVFAARVEMHLPLAH
ncbi:MAG TPA: hypothetical protein VKZ79_04850 [Alphaproteobacteria bacterium]|nr:hypothetical protein [Alphaproteobacteria bacterium]